MAQILRILGQSKPSAAALTDIYTVPGSTSTVVSTIVATNQSATPTAIRISVAVAALADTTKQYIAYDLAIAGNQVISFTLGITLAATDVIRVYNTLATVSFNVFGAENTLMGIDYTPPNTSAAGITQLTGDVTAGPGSGSQAATIGAGKVTEAMQVLANNTTQNVSTTKHGYAPLLPNDATKYLDGTGNYTVPAGSGGGSVTNVATGSYLTGGPITTTGTIDASTGTIGILEAAQQKLLGGI